MQISPTTHSLLVIFLIFPAIVFAREIPEQAFQICAKEEVKCKHEADRAHVLCLSDCRSEYPLMSSEPVVSPESCRRYGEFRICIEDCVSEYLELLEQCRKAYQECLLAFEEDSVGPSERC